MDLAKKSPSMIVAPTAPPLVLVGSSTIVLGVPTLAQEETIMPTLSAILSLSSEGRRSIAISMEVTKISMPLDKAFMIEETVPPASTPIRVGGATFLPMGEPSVESMSISNPYVETGGSWPLALRVEEAGAKLEARK